ncbi:MAG: hypothetical protein AAB527_02815 [Patescibacteria group bacterium]
MNSRDIDQFLKYSDEVVSGLEEALRMLRLEKNTLVHEMLKAQSSRGNIIHKLVQEFLPDLEPETLARLRDTFPRFVAGQVETIFTEAEKIRVPFWSRLKIGSADYKAGVLGDQLDILRVKLAATFDNLDMIGTVSRQTLMVQQANERISRLQKEMEGNAEKFSQLETKLNSFKLAHDDVSRGARVEIPEEVMKDIEDIAAKFRSVKRGGRGRRAVVSMSRVREDHVELRQEDDGYGDVIFYLLTDIPVSPRTLLFYAMFGDHGEARAQEPDFVGSGAVVNEIVESSAVVGGDIVGGNFAEGERVEAESFSPMSEPDSASSDSEEDVGSLS